MNGRETTINSAAIADIGPAQYSILPKYLIFCVATGFVINLDIVVSIIINRLYIRLLIYL